MKIPVIGLIPLMAGLLFGPSVSALAQDRSALEVVTRIMGTYAVVPNITYVTVGDWEGKLDIYVPRGLEAPNKTLVYYHGGGWQAGTKEERSLLLLPYMLNGWTIVNVEYRLGGAAPAPAAAEDAWCALDWVFRNASESFRTSSERVQFHFDPNRVVTTGTSAGAHLALLVAMAPRSAGLDTNCPAGPDTETEHRVAAVADWFGITDVMELRGPEGTPSLGGDWVGYGPNAEAIARQVSPVTYVRKDVPPIISVHGDADTGVPYAQKQRFHEALEQVGATHKLIAIKDGGHGIFKREEQLDAYAAMEAFMLEHVGQ